ncbi:MAG TPA: peptidase C39 family protein [Candidatus Kapabacteria bacterium]|nr:peptidase C39 family protein [Candidatus Kapabacteria bacterium]
MRAWIILFVACLSVCLHAESPRDFRGTHFIGFDRFDKFEVKKTDAGTELTSSPIKPAIQWNELVASWNFRSAPTNTLLIEAQAISKDRNTKWYTLAYWTQNPVSKSDRSSLRGQKDDDGTVSTDTLKLKEPAEAVRLRLTLGPGADPKDLKFLGLSFRDTTSETTPLAPNKSVWGKTLTVKERSQANYPDGISEWCSPTSMSMLLSFWAAKLNRPELDYDVPEVARGVNDPGWPGTGNWPFNTAFAGAHPGIRSYVTRFSDVSELEAWIEAGIPVAISVAYGYLKGKPEPANGHLVVCIGFDEDGNIVVNDPGRSQVRRIYLRENLIKAWAESQNTVYIVHPEKWKIPPDRFGHWAE